MGIIFSMRTLNDFIRLLYKNIRFLIHIFIYSVRMTIIGTKVHFLNFLRNGSRKKVNKDDRVKGTVFKFIALIQDKRNF